MRGEWKEMVPAERGDQRRRRMTPSNGMPLRARLVASGAEFANKRGFYLGRRSAKIHMVLYRRSGGRIGRHVPGWPEARILLVDHIGAKSGLRRASPLIYQKDGELVAVAASKAGQPTHPACFHNLKANPDTTIQIGSVVRTVRARVATDEERSCLWPKFVASYSGFDFFQRNAKGRKIPIVIFEPR
jgi:deazaflavin-dependent oxidoreductase (nitroreductase family)